MKFTIETTQVNTDGPVAAQGCNAIIFTNASDAAITVDNVTIPAYASGMQEYPSLTYYGLQGETMENKFAVKFGSATTKIVFVTRKKYI